MTTSFSRSGQPRDRLGERLARLGLVERLGGLDAAFGSSIVSSSETWSPSPEVDQSSSSAAIDEREMSVSDSSSSSVEMPTFAGDLLVARRPAELALELPDRPLDLARPRTDRARHPVERAQLVDDRAADPGDRVGLELDVALRVVAVDRADQPEQPVRDEIALVDVRRQPRAEPAGDVLDERRVVDDQPVAQRFVAASAGTRATGSCCRFHRPRRENTS